MRTDVDNLRNLAGASFLVLSGLLSACNGGDSLNTTDPSAAASPSPSAGAAPSATGGTSSGTVPVPAASAPANISAAVTGSPGGPVVFFSDVQAGPIQDGPGGLGVPITLFGKGFGAQRGDSRVTINGVEVASYLLWGQNNANNPSLDMIVVQPGPAITAAGPIVVQVAGKTSNTEHSFAPTLGKVYAVAPTGSDSASCSLAQPCATILHAATNVLKAGDALLVRGGPLNDNEIWIRDSLGHSGTANAPKVIRNYPGETPRFVNASRPVILDANYLTLSGFAFEGGKSVGVGNIGLRGIQVINSTFIGTIGFDAIGTHGDQITLAGNVCDVSGSNVGTQGHCYYISHGSDIRLLYNIGRGAPGYGIYIFDQRRSSPDIRRVISNVLVEGNVLSASPERSGMIIAMSDEGAMGNYIDTVIVRNNVFAANNFAGLAIGGVVQNVKVYNNTFDRNGRQGITIYDEATVNGIDIRNNLIDQSTNTFCISNCSWYAQAHVQKGSAARNVTLANNYFAPGPSIVIGASDPSAAAGPSAFNNADGLDWHLRPGAGAIGQAASVLEVTRDFDGRARPASGPATAGAFESP